MRPRYFRQRQQNAHLFKLAEFFVPKVNTHARNKRPCHVVFCEATNRKIGNLHTKTTILKNLSISTA